MKQEHDLHHDSEVRAFFVIVLLCMRLCMRVRQLRATLEAEGRGEVHRFDAVAPVPDTADTKVDWDAVLALQAAGVPHSPVAVPPT